MHLISVYSLEKSWNKFSMGQMQAIEEFKKGKVEYRADKTGIVHIPYGKTSFSEEDLIINLLATVVSYRISFHSLVCSQLFCFWSYSMCCINDLLLQRSVEANKPSGAKGVYWKTAHICSSMGPSIRLNIRDVLDYKLPWYAQLFAHCKCKAFWPWI